MQALDAQSKVRSPGLRGSMLRNEKQRKRKEASMPPLTMEDATIQFRIDRRFHYL